MKYLAAYALVALSGRTPSQDDVTAVLKAAHTDIDAARVEALFAELADKNFDEVCAAGKAKLVGAGASAAAGAPAAAAAASSSAAAPAAAESKKAAEPAEEEDDDMGFGLFD